MMLSTPRPVFEHDEEAQYFYAILPEGRAAMEYRTNREGKIFVTHTEVSDALKGKGVGNMLARYVLDHIRKNKLKIVPLCPFMAAYMKKHPESLDLLSAGIHLK